MVRAERRVSGAAVVVTGGETETEKSNRSSLTANSGRTSVSRVSVLGDAEALAGFKARRKT